MPYRTWTFWTVCLGIIGLVVLGGCLAFGGDPRRAATTGPRWKRKLVTAALTLLGISAGIGVGADRRPEPRPTCYKPVRRPGQGVTAPVDAVTLSPAATKNQQALWDKAVAAWAAGRDIVGRERMTYPMSAKEKAKLLADLNTAVANVAQLHTDSLIAKPMADLFTADLKDLIGAVNRFRARPDGNGPAATCYRPAAPPRYPQTNLVRLADRVDELEGIVAAKRLSPAVSVQTARIIHRDLRMLTNPVYSRRLTEAERKKAADLVARTKALLAKLNVPAGPAEPSALARAEQWKELQAVLDRGRQYATAGSTGDQRAQWTRELDATRKNLEELTRQGYLSATAQAALLGRLSDVRAAVFAKPPTDLTAKCYKVMVVVPARTSLKALSTRLPMLERMLRAERLRPAVVAALLPGLQADLENLTDPVQLRTLSDAEQATAKEMAAKLQAAMNDLQTFVAPARPKTTGLAPPNVPMPRE